MKKLENMSNSELWEIFPIILEKYDYRWPANYRQTKKKLLTELKDQIVRINHFGSTAVENLIAKPTIDILVEVRAGFDKAKVKAKLEKLGFRFMREDQEPYYNLYFTKGYTEAGFSGQVYHVHVRKFDDWGELYFRDYLRKHQDVANKYACLKLVLKEKFEHHRDNYTEAKGEFIRHYTAIARELYKDRYKKQGKIPV